MPIDRASRRSAKRMDAALVVGLILFAPAPTQAQSGGGGRPSLVVAASEEAQTVFSPAQACDGDDVPDVNARAFRAADGEIVVYALHDLNRALRGADLGHLKIDCASAFRGHGDENPAAYDDHAWIAAVWTKDGRKIDALIHHEYHANEHDGRCVSRDAMACWHNTILEATSNDEGRSFVKDPAPVVASSPFGQDVDQTRHRGFFNPSNIIAFNGAWYVFISTTGWPGQSWGACLFRTETPDDSTSWRAFDGKAFTIAYRDPYRTTGANPRPCRIVAPFGAPVGSVTRDRASGDFLAVWQAHADSGVFPVSGFYYATSRDLTTWSGPRLLLAGPTLYDDPCRSSGRLINYPSILDEDSKSRIFADAGARPWLYYASLGVSACNVGSDRVLLRRRLSVSPAKAEPIQ